MDSDDLPAVEGEETPAAEPIDELDVDVFEEIPDELAEAEVASAEEALPVEEWSLAPAPPEPPPPPVVDYGTPMQTSGMAIASLVMGIAGWTLLPLVGSILAIILGYAARRDIRRRPNELTGEGMAIAGLVLGWIMVVLSVIGLCIGAFAFCFLIEAIGTTTGY
jgi:hypothetical protein